jgi:hypothetical protein
VRVTVLREASLQLKRAAGMAEAGEGVRIGTPATAEAAR